MTRRTYVKRSRLEAPAEEVFEDLLPLAERFVELLADTGVSHGLIGPREVDRL